MVSSFLVQFSEFITFKFVDNSSNVGAEECIIGSEDLTNSYKKKIKKYQNQRIQFNIFFWKVHLISK